MSDDPPAAGEDLYLLDNPVQNYAWGSVSTIPELLGLEATGEPVAELWIGAHPAAPSRVVAAESIRSLIELISEQPQVLLGPGVVDRFDGLPFLLKILAVAHPLSLQAHPSLAQAVAGFVAENDAGVPLDSPGATTADANHKPEQVCALTEFEGLCGFRPVPETVRFLDALDTPVLRALGTRLRADDGLRDVVIDVLTRSSESIATILDELVRRPPTGRCRWCLVGRSRLDRRPGRGVSRRSGCGYRRADEPVPTGAGGGGFPAAGVLHAYLRGVSVELLANSDNVLRGGLTPKHIDVPALVDILRIEETVVQVETGVASPDGELVYPSGVEDFRLSRLEFDGIDGAPVILIGGAPRILLCTSGAVRIVAGAVGTDAGLVLRRGAGAFVSAAATVLVEPVDGPATTFVAAPNLPPRDGSVGI